tara:strand:- start:2003 stop:2506 length:504 start_codon:yes stop_codon:yes gene_type:complete
MITLALIILCASILLYSTKQIKDVTGNCATLEAKLKELGENIDSSRKRLRKKLNRNQSIQKTSSNEAIPQISFQKLGFTACALLPSDTVYTLANDEGCGLSGTCEGNGDCGLCAMAIISGAKNFDPASDLEKEILEKLSYPKGTRLSCQAKIRGDATVNFMNVEGQV